MSPTRQFLTGVGRARLLIVVSAAVTLAFVGACGSEGQVGESCSGDSECGFGLQCFQPSEEATSLCTIGCEDTPCAQGICIETVQGQVCAAACADGAESCRSDLVCQLAKSGDEVCWYLDSTLESLPEGLEVGRVEITEDTNQDGKLNAGESATVHIYGKNIGAKTLSGLWAQVDDHDPMLGIQTCKVPAYPAWLTCTAACNCQAHAMQTVVTATARAESADPVLSMTVEVSDLATEDLVLSLTFHDDLGRSWVREAVVPISDSQGSVQIEDVTLLTDQNGDGKLSPGETGSVGIRVKNSGITQVRALWASMETVDPAVTITGCYAGIGTQWMACDAACSCEQVQGSAKPTLEPEEVSADALLRVDFVLDETAPVAPISFAPTIHDELGVQWTDTAPVTVYEPTAELVISHMELLNDGNGDGFLSPAEHARVQFFVKNVGITKATDVWAELLSTSAVVQVEQCLAGVGGTFVPCDTDCSCEGAMASAKQQLDAGEVLDVAIFAMDIQIAPDAPLEAIDFEIGLHDAAGAVWSDSSSVLVLSPDSKVEISTVIILDDTNGDGALSPAEDATVEVRAKNTGSSKALGVWAKVSATPSWLSVDHCFAMSELKLSACDLECSCADLAEEHKQTLEAGQVGTLPILQFRLKISPDTPLESQTFEVTFGDAFGNEWTDTYTVDIVHMDAVIQIDTVNLWDDTNLDGELSPGESAKVQLKVKNLGTSMTEGLWAELLEADENLEITSCYVQVSSTWTKCDSSCSCAGVTPLAKQTLLPNTTGDLAILRLNLQLDPGAPTEPLSFLVRFHDKFGNTWDDTFILDVKEYSATIEVGVSTVTDDTNQDGVVSPGESAVLTVYPSNTGEMKALGLWSKLGTVTPVAQIDSCYVSAEGSWVKCDSACSCDGLFDSTLQDLDAGQTSEVPILQVFFTVNTLVENQSMGLDIAFTDTLLFTWTDTVFVEVVEPDVDISVAFAEVSEDSNGDDLANPGELVTIDVFAQNTGSALAMGLWAKSDLIDDNFLLDSCYVVAGDLLAKCDSQCTCHNVFDALKQDIEGNQTRDEPILRMIGTVSGDAVLAPMTFQVTITDLFENTSTDTFIVPVESAP